MPLEAGRYPAINTAYLLNGQAVIRENVARSAVSADVAALSTGVMLGAAIHLENGDVISKLAAAIGHTAAGTPTHSFFALYDTSATPALLGQSVDQLTGAIAADAMYEQTLATAITITKTGLYIAAFMVTATTPPTLWCKQFAANSYLNTAGITGQKALAQTSGSALTGAAPATWATPAASLNVPYITAR